MMALATARGGPTSHTAILARTLGLPEGTFKARLFRGREILRGKLPQLLAMPQLKEA